MISRSDGDRGLHFWVADRGGAAAVPGLARCWLWSRRACAGSRSACRGRDRRSAALSDAQRRPGAGGGPLAQGGRRSGRRLRRSELRRRGCALRRPASGSRQERCKDCHFWLRSAKPQLQLLRAIVQCIIISCGVPTDADRGHVSLRRVSRIRPPHGARRVASRG